MIPVVHTRWKNFDATWLRPKELNTGALRRRNRAVHDRRTRVKSFVKHADQWLGICISNI